MLRNDQQLGHRWLRLKLSGSRSNRDAIGTMVTLRIADLTQTRQLVPTRSYLSQSELALTFGLGKTADVESIRIQWPSGQTELLRPAPPASQRILFIKESGG